MGGEMERKVRLSELKPGEEGEVTDYAGGAEVQYRLMELGILPGTRLRFIRRAPMGDPLEVEVRGFHLSLREREAANIGVRLA
jgi:Fe2+ transport system protein FeoA